MFEVYLALMLLASPEQAYALLDEVPPLLESGDIELARSKTDEALRLDPENYDALVLAAALAEGAGDLARALSFHERLLELDANADDSRLAVARLHLKRGEFEQARARNEELLERHPQSEDGLALRKAIKARVAPADSSGTGYSPLVRLDLISGYDSNPTLRNEEATGGAAVETEAPSVAILTMDGTVGFYDEGKDRPLTVLGRVRTTRPFDDDEAVGNALASTIGVTAIGRRRLSKQIVGLVDLRYQGLFVDGFQDFVQHFVAPSLLATYDTGPHQLRALLGAELRFFDGLVNDSVTPRLSLRDTLRVGRGLIVADIGGRLGIDLGEDTDAGSRFVGSQEGSFLLFGQYDFLERLTGFVGTDIRWRAFDTFNGNDPRETLLQVFAGLRYKLGIYELHAEYGYSQALAGALREFDRQQVTAGVRVWYY
ncbi:MAG: tetratricopeptide repeat protein [Myxococcota bacterium]